MSLFKRPRNVLDSKVTIDEPGDVYLHFPIEHSCPVCQAKLRVTFIYAMNKRNLSENKLIGMRSTAHNCIPSYVPGEPKKVTDASRYGYT